MTNWTSKPKQTTSWSEIGKNSTSWSEKAKTTSLGIWSSGTLPWQESLPWQMSSPGLTSWNNQPKA